MGAIIPTFMSYALEKRLSRHPERFGHGAIEGVAGPESANNAATGGALIPLLTLGVAPNVPMAVLLGAFLLHGVQPGPLMITERPELFWGVVASMYVGNVLLLVLNLPLIGLWVQLLRVPYGILFPLILLFCVIGVWSESGNTADLVVLLIFGLLGYLMKKLDFEPAPLVLAFVLGRMAEEALRQSLLLSRGSPAILVTRPLASAILALAVALAVLPAVRWSWGASSGPPRAPLTARGTPAEPWRPSISASSAALQQLLGDALDVGGFHLALVRLHDVAHQAAHLLGVVDPQRGDALLHQRAQRGLVHGPREIALAEFDLDAKLRRLLGTAVPHLLVLDERLLELLAVGADHVEEQGIVDGPREALGRRALGELRLDHADDVGRRHVLVLDGLPERVVERLLDTHRPRLDG